MVSRGAQEVRQPLLELTSEAAGTLRDRASHGSGTLRTAVAAVRAVLTGRNPVLAAVRAWFVAQSTPVKISLIVGLVLLALLAPVVGLLLALALAVAAVVVWVRTPATA